MSDNSKDSLSRYKSEWSARIEILKQTLAAGNKSSEAAGLITETKSLADKTEALTELLRAFQESAAHEIRQLSRRVEELEAFVKAKEIDLQNLKSESVEHRLVLKEVKENPRDKGWVETCEDLHNQMQGLRELLLVLRQRAFETRSFPKETAEVPVLFMTEEKPALKRWLEWWNEPVTKIKLPRKGSD